ncbi:hypothetical protein FE783_25680 [Paenibacillus mesophilus]|uniref:hypothetical protein n=1 Tax=Paenibacillus mesophilus TaxID=2582849 RepID=UPI00110EED71|nr:hypothetical protein [Paenibacillus mesophilus]TMV46699.1 hypothetical protein FE783_25680 [Paenibacillus mesophilus]
MSRFWLVPISTSDPFTLGGERFICSPDEELAEFRQALSRFRPQLLLPFKAHLLPGEEDTDACGTEHVPFSLAAPGDIVFDGKALHLSDCASAMLDRLPAPEEAGRRLDEIEASFATDLPENVRTWLGTMRRWYGQGLRVIMLKEEP